MSDRVGAGSARNKGASFSKGELFAFIDDDCIAKKDWIEEILKYFFNYTNKNFIAVGGKVLPFNKNGGLINRYLSYINHLDGPLFENGEIVNEFYSLIQPPDNEYSWHNIGVHGIRPHETESAPTFYHVFQKILPLLRPTIQSGTSTASPETSKASLG